jgi:hypothetical protein
LEIHALFGLCGLAANEPGGDFQGSKEVDRAVSLVGALEAVNDLTAACLNIAPRPFQGLDRRLFVDAEHQRVLRGVKVQADNISGFCRKLRVGTDTPRAMPAQLDAFFAQYAPNRGIRNAKRRGQCTAVPSGQPWRCWQLQLPQNAPAQFLPIFRLLARPRLIVKPGDAACRKPLAPQTDGVWPHPKFARHFVIALTLKAGQNNLGALDQAGFLGPATGKVHQLSSLFGRTRQRYRDPGHETPHVLRAPEVHTIYRISTQLSTSTALRHRKRWSALLVIPAKAGIYGAIGTGLRRCDVVDDTTTDTGNRSDARCAQSLWAMIRARTGGK